MDHELRVGWCACSVCVRVRPRVVCGRENISRLQMACENCTKLSSCQMLFSVSHVQREGVPRFVTVNPSM